MLLHNQVTPVVVFDGDRLPMKKGEEEKRHKYVPIHSDLKIDSRLLTFQNV